MSCNIHPTAVVDKKAEIGSEVIVGPYSVIGPNVKIGDRCVIAPHVVIIGITTMGADNRLSSFVCIGGEPQDLKYKGEPSTIVIGNRNVFREYVTVHPGTASGRMSTVIGDGNMFMASSHVAHDCIVGNQCVFANSVALGGHVTMGDRVILGGMVGVHQFCRIGSLAILSGGAMAGQDVPPYCIVQGDRGHLRGINLIGLKRAGFTPQEISNVKRAYRILFRRLGNIEEKLANFPPELAAAPRVREMLEFLKGSRRGICQPAKVLSAK